MNGHNPDWIALQRFLNRNLLTEKGTPTEFFQSLFQSISYGGRKTFLSNPINSFTHCRTFRAPVLT